MAENWKNAPGLKAKIPEFLVPEDEYRETIGEPEDADIRRLVYGDRGRVSYVLKNGVQSYEAPFYQEFLEQCNEQTKLFQSALEEAFKRHNLPLSTRNKASAWKRLSWFIRPPLFTSKAKKGEKAEGRSQQRNNEIQSFIHLDPDGEYHFFRTNYQNVNQEWSLFSGLIGLYLEAKAQEGTFKEPNWPEIAEGIASYIAKSTNLAKEFEAEIPTYDELKSRLHEPWHYLMPPREAIKRYIRFQLLQGINSSEITQQITTLITEANSQFFQQKHASTIGSPKDQAAYKLNPQEIEALVRETEKSILAQKPTQPQ